jgi:sugar phosphate permease
LGFLCSLGAITYLDRIAISVAGPRIQEDLSLGPEMWGWVVGIFTVSYALFEIPTGRMGDKTGPRRVLTRVVLWWSAFTALTGAALNYPVLLVTRFLFGAGEAGAFPNTGISLSRWFPKRERGRAFGMFLMSTQIGGALSPLLIVPLQMWFGWRATFYFLGVIGVLWSIGWYRWYRDSPREKPGVTDEEIEEIGTGALEDNHQMPWGVALRSTNLWAMFLLVICYVFALYFFISWLHTYMVKGRGFSEDALVFSAGPPILGAVGNFVGGYLSDRLSARYGLKWGRRSVGLAGMICATFFMAATIITPGKYLALLFLGFVYAGITLQQSAFCAVLLDVGRQYVGGIGGATNMFGNFGGFAFSVSFGYFVTWFGSYDLALIPVVGALALGTLSWLRIDAAEGIIPDVNIDAPIPEAVPA